MKSKYAPSNGLLSIYPISMSTEVRHTVREEREDYVHVLFSLILYCYRLYTILCLLLNTLCHICVETVLFTYW